MQLFGLQTHGQFLTSEDNFDSFVNSFKRLAQIITGQDMINLTYELGNRAFSCISVFFAFSVTLLFVFANLFVVVLVDSFIPV